MMKNIESRERADQRPPSLSPRFISISVCVVFVRSVVARTYAARLSHLLLRIVNSESVCSNLVVVESIEGHRGGSQVCVVQKAVAAISAESEALESRAVAENLD